MNTQIKITIAVLCIGILGATATKAQDSASEPKPPSDLSAPDQPLTKADTHSLAGVQNLTLGSSKDSLLLPSFGVTTNVQNNPFNANVTNSPSVISTTFLSARLALNKISEHSELLLDYLAGGRLSNDPQQGNAPLQGLAVSETIRAGRWTEILGDQFSYLPAASFNFGGLGSVNNLGVPSASATSPGFRGDLLPGDSIITQGDRITNAVLSQTDYALSPRSSLTFLGLYGLLNFNGNGFQDNRYADGRIGLNYLLDPLDSVSIFYNFNKQMFPNLRQGVSSHTAELVYGRRITNHLAFDLGAGPDVQVYEAVVSGPPTAITWAASSHLIYRMAQTDAAFGYSHSLSGGSGLFAGSETDVLTGDVHRQLKAYWQGGLSGGYSRNRGLQQTTVVPNVVNGWFAGVRLSRIFVRSRSLSIAYNLSKENNLAAICTSPGCTSGSLVHTVSISYNWALRPVELE